MSASFNDDSYNNSGHFTATAVANAARNDDDDDEHVNEIEKISRKETIRVRVWRYAVSFMLLMTIAVTITTYAFLDQEEDHNFQTAFVQFSRALGDAALRQQKALRDALAGFSTTITLYAEGHDADWPFFYLPGYQKYAADFLKLSHSELVAINNVVTRDQKEDYEAYVAKNNERWIQNGHLVKYGNLDLLNTDQERYIPYISRRTKEGKFIPDDDRDLYYARIAFSPPPRAYGPVINWNMGSVHGAILESLRDLGNETLTSLAKPVSILPKDEHAGYHTDAEADNPHSFVFHPVYRNTESNSSDIVAVVIAGFAWDASMLDLLHEDLVGIFCVIESSCNQSFTYEIDGKDAFYRGQGDLHDPKYNSMRFSVDLSISDNPRLDNAKGHCKFRMNIYPSDHFKSTYETNLPKIFASVVASAFGLVALLFLVYDTMVQQRNNKIVKTAARSNYLVSNLFPGSIRDKVLEQHSRTNTGSAKDRKKSMANGVISFLRDSSVSHEEDPKPHDDTQPLAELFPDATVFFADIAGFTAWSSTREPTKVFLLLEFLYSSFDRIAQRRGVFKVETVGDCYMAVTGVHPKRADHAVVMARFARDCMHKMRALTDKLEVTLGPDTGDLRLRIGMHSGPVTAGVLRGAKARFQLFGDTVNTASRMESTGRPGAIQVSMETAQLLAIAGKSSWFSQRTDAVAVKGKGEMQTCWLKLNGTSSVHYLDDATSVDDVPVRSSDIRNSWDSGDGDIGNTDERTSRLVDWNVELLVQMLKQIVAQRSSKSHDAGNNTNADPLTNITTSTSTPLDEVKEIIRLPEFDTKLASRGQDPDKVTIPTTIVEELHDYVSCVASLYRPNPFHNFAHASHVTMSVIKLMSRIVDTAPPSNDDGNGRAGGKASSSKKSKTDIVTAASWRHDNSCGITSDPLTQFACAFSALIHDVDHRGVSNQQLMKENEELASLFKGRSVAEQNSFDICWRLLMDSRFALLRGTIFSSSEELARFRQLVINSVMATDILDEELKALRNARWDKAFKITSQSTNESPRDSMDRKATIVIEHLIQASDVAHTMQHWHVYRKWNERLFEELYEAYRAGRAGKDPSTFWYEGELKFFDYYIIPLAKKLKDCGVFGVSSDEYLNYAINNRSEWEARGRNILEEMVERAQLSEF